MILTALFFYVFLSCIFRAVGTGSLRHASSGKYMIAAVRLLFCRILKVTGTSSGIFPHFKS